MGMIIELFSGSLKVYDDETRQAIAALLGEIDVNAATELWEAALEDTWHGAPAWIHGDVSAGNLLVKNGSLSAVIDFGGLGVGEPACDLTIAWTFLSNLFTPTQKKQQTPNT